METTSPEDGIRRTFVYRTDHVATEDSNGSIMGKPYNSYLEHLDVVDAKVKGTKISLNSNPMMTSLSFTKHCPKWYFLTIQLNWNTKITP